MSAPERIYLHGWDPDYPHDASWCADQVDDDDVVYVRLRSAPGETEQETFGRDYWTQRVDKMLNTEEPSPVGAAFVLGREYGNASLEDAGYIQDELDRLHGLTAPTHDLEALREALEERVAGVINNYYAEYPHGSASPLARRILGEVLND